MLYLFIIAKKNKNKFKVIPVITGILVIVLCIVAFIYLNKSVSVYSQIKSVADFAIATTTSPQIVVPTLDKTLYDQMMIRLANYPVKKVATSTTKLMATSTIYAATLAMIKKPWPVGAPYPNAGAILPFNRIVAYYGNFYSGALGVLGQYPPEEMLQHLMSEVKKWQAADPETHVIPALDYIAVVAQGAPGPDGMYRTRMPASQIQEAIDLANTVNGLVILDVQVGRSTLEKEVPLLAPFLKLPNVELAIDPEFSMKNSEVPGRAIGTFDATDINYVAEYLAQIVTKYHLPPKVLIVHRFTEDMVTNYKNIHLLPEVQVLIDMDGYGTVAQKTKAYRLVITDEPVQFAGLKLFYKNDIAHGGRLMTPEEVMALQPRPSFIQYQ